MKFTDESERPVAGPRIIRTTDVPPVDLSERDDVRPTVDIRPIDEMLGLAQLGAKLWEFQPGEEIGFHSHTAEEELYYVLEGEFSLKLGSADDPTYETVGPGTFFAALPREPHGHRCVGDEPGVILAVGASTGEDDEVFDPHNPN